MKKTRTNFFSGMMKRGLMILSLFCIFMAVSPNTVNAQYVEQDEAIEILKQEAKHLVDPSYIQTLSTVELNRLSVKRQAVKNVLLQLFEGVTVANAVANVIGTDQPANTVGTSTGFSRGYILSTKENQTWLNNYLKDLLSN